MNLKRMGEKYGWDKLQEWLVPIFEKLPNISLSSFVDLLCELSQAKKNIPTYPFNIERLAYRINPAEEITEQIKGKQLETCQRLANIVTQKFMNYIPEKPHTTAPRYSYNSILDTPVIDHHLVSLVADMFKVLFTVRLHLALETIVGHIITNPKYYDIDSVLLPALKDLSSWVKITTKENIPAYNMLAHHAIKILEERTSQDIPNNWAQNVNWACCQDCTDLQNFLRNPTNNTYQFMGTKARRNHLEKQIQTNKCEVDYRTIGTGRQQTLVCTKNKKEYNKKVTERNRIIQTIKELKASLGDNISSTSLSSNTEHSKKTPKKKDSILV